MVLIYTILTIILFRTCSCESSNFIEIPSFSQHGNPVPTEDHELNDYKVDNPLFSDEKTVFPMPHLYSGDVHAHEDGEAFLNKSDEELINNEFDFESEAKKTDRFIPYTYVIELSETYEDNLPKSTLNDNPFSTSGSQAYPSPHPVFTAGAEVKPIPSSISSATTNSQLNLVLHPISAAGSQVQPFSHTISIDGSQFNPFSSLATASGSHVSPVPNPVPQVYYIPFPVGVNGAPLYQIPRLKSEEVEKKTEVFVEKGYDRGAYDHQGYEDHTKEWDQYKQKEEGRYGGTASSKKKEMEKYSEDLHPVNDNHLDDHLERSYSHHPSVRIKSKRMKSGNRNSFSKKRPRKPSRNGYPRKRPTRPRNNLIKIPSVHQSNFAKHSGNRVRKSRPKATLELTTSADQKTLDSSRSIEKDLKNLFSIPVYSSYYNNFHSDHTIPAFPYANHDGSRHKKEVNKKRFHPSNSFRFPWTRSSKTPYTRFRSSIPTKSKDLGQPEDLLRKEPCLSPVAVTANFKFGSLKPDLGPPEWYDREPHILEPLKGQVDHLREQVYAPVLREALCI